MVDILSRTHELLSEHINMDPFPLMMGEMGETISLMSFSGRIATQVKTTLSCELWM
jgi:cytoplasmic FMR1 interacting protein